MKCLQDIKRGGGEGGRGEGETYFYELLMALIKKNNVSLLFLRKINWGSYEKIIRFYFLYEILKEFIFFKKIS